MTMKAKFIGDEALLGTGGLFFDFAYNKSVLVNKPRTEQNGLITLNLDDTDDVVIDDITGFVNNGGTVEGVPVYLKLSTPQYNQNVPAEIPHNQKPDPGNPPNTVNRKWNEWKDSTHSHGDSSTATFKLIPGNAFGTELTGTEIKFLVDSGIIVLDTTEYLADLP